MFSRLLSLPAPDALLGEDLSQLTPALFVMPELSVHGEEEAPRNELKLDDKRVLAFNILMYTTTKHTATCGSLKTSPPSAPLPKRLIFPERDTHDRGIQPPRFGAGWNAWSSVQTGANSDSAGGF